MRKQQSHLTMMSYKTNTADAPDSSTPFKPNVNNRHLELAPFLN